MAVRLHFNVGFPTLLTNVPNLEKRIETKGQPTSITKVYDCRFRFNWNDGTYCHIKGFSNENRTITKVEINPLTPQDQNFFTKTRTSRMACSF